MNPVENSRAQPIHSLERMVNQTSGARDGLSEFDLFREDIVMASDDPSRLLGVVESVGGHSDSEDDEEGHEHVPLERGKARVSWYRRTDNPSTVNVSDLVVVDRALLHHDIVSLRSDPLGQTGFVTDVSLYCDVKCLKSGEITRNVKTCDLIPVQPLKRGTYVVHGHWLGKVDECHEHVIVRWGDGSICRVDNADPDYLLPEGWFEGIQDEDCPYYPGVTVTATRGVLQREAKWLKGRHRDQSQGSGVVMSVSPGRTFVRWVWSSPTVPPDTEEPDEEVEDGQQLRVLSAFAHTWFQLGDYALSPPPAPADTLDAPPANPEGDVEGDEAGKAAEAGAGNSAACSAGAAVALSGAQKKSRRAAKSSGVAMFRYPKRGARGNGNSPPPPDDIDRCVEVIGTRTQVTVTWQDGLSSGPHSTTALVPIKHIGAHDFWPDEFVVEKLDDEAQERSVQSNAHVDPTTLPAGGMFGLGAALNQSREADGSSGWPAVATSLRNEIYSCLNTDERSELERALSSPEVSLALQQAHGMTDVYERMTRVFADHPLLLRITEAVRTSPQWQGAIRDGTVQSFEEQILAWLGIHAPAQRRRRMGVIVTADWKERVCLVDWIGYCNSEGGKETLGEKALEEEGLMPQDEAGARRLGRAEVSSYEVLEHPQYTYSAGDVVVRVVKPSSYAEGTPGGRASVGGGAQRHEEVSNGGQEDEEGWETVSEHTTDADDDYDHDASGKNWEEEEGVTSEGRKLEAHETNEIVAKKRVNAGPELDAHVNDSAQEMVGQDKMGAATQEVVASSRRLPVGWAEHIDPVTGRAYYYHERTGQSRWERPRPIALGWTSIIDAGTGLEYFYNSRTGESRWTAPTGPIWRSSALVGPGDASPTAQDWVGEVVSMRAGKLRIQWLEGKLEWVSPGDVYVVGVENEDDWNQDGTGSEEGSEWETIGSGDGAAGAGGASVAAQADNMFGGEQGTGVVEAGGMMLPWQVDVEVDGDETSTDDDGDETSTERKSLMVKQGNDDEITASVQADEIITGEQADEIITGVQADYGDMMDEDDAGNEGGLAEAPSRDGGKGKLVYAVDSMAFLLNSVSNVVGGFFGRATENEEARGHRAKGGASANLMENDARETEHIEVSENEGDDVGSADGDAEAGQGCNDDEGVKGGLDQFLVEEELSHHHFAGKGGGGAPPTRDFVKKVKQEWKLLRSSLPGGVFVRGCESRMDLLRAVIVGATKTPYEDGLFAFDFFLPADYPSSPPQVYFWSYGDRLNPNLYDNGKVCLSLLGTWSGDQVEAWDPAKSNILQVLISIQGLVLVPEPYYNEAGYEKQVGTLEGRHNSRQYNESTLLLTLKHMTVTLANPIEPFSGFIRAHFRHRREAILSRCKRIIDGASHDIGGMQAGPSPAAENGTAGGGADDDAGWADRSVPETASKGFLLSLKKLQPKLEGALPKST